jgi:hypothetical protein
MMGGLGSSKSTACDGCHGPGSSGSPGCMRTLISEVACDQSGSGLRVRGKVGYGNLGRRIGYLGAGISEGCFRMSLPSSPYI